MILQPNCFHDIGYDNVLAITIHQTRVCLSLLVGPEIMNDNGTKMISIPNGYHNIVEIEYIHHNLRLHRVVILLGVRNKSLHTDFSV